MGVGREREMTPMRRVLMHHARGRPYPAPLASFRSLRLRSNYVLSRERVLVPRGMFVFVNLITIAPHATHLRIRIAHGNAPCTASANAGSLSCRTCIHTRT